MPPTEPQTIGSEPQTMLRHRNGHNQPDYSMTEGGGDVVDSPWQPQPAPVLPILIIDQQVANDEDVHGPRHLPRIPFDLTSQPLDQLPKQFKKAFFPRPGITVDIVFLILGLLFAFYDIASDFWLAYSYHREGEYWWSLMTFGFASFINVYRICQKRSQPLTSSWIYKDPDTNGVSLITIPNHDNDAKRLDEIGSRTWMICGVIAASLFVGVANVYLSVDDHKPIVQTMFIFALICGTIAITGFYCFDALAFYKMVINNRHAFDYDRNMKINNRFDFTKQHELFGETLPQLCLQVYIWMGTKTLAKNHYLELAVIFKIVCAIAMLGVSSYSLNKSISRQTHSLLTDFTKEGSPERNGILRFKAFFSFASRVLTIAVTFAIFGPQVCVSLALRIVFMIYKRHGNTTYSKFGLLDVLYAIFLSDEFRFSYARRQDNEIKRDYDRKQARRLMMSENLLLQLCVIYVMACPDAWHLSNLFQVYAAVAMALQIIALGLTNWSTVLNRTAFREPLEVVQDYYRFALVAAFERPELLQFAEMFANHVPVRQGFCDVFKDLRLFGLSNGSRHKIHEKISDKIRNYLIDNGIEVVIDYEWKLSSPLKYLENRVLV